MFNDDVRDNSDFASDLDPEFQKVWSAAVKHMNRIRVLIIATWIGGFILLSGLFLGLGFVIAKLVNS